MSVRSAIRTLDLLELLAQQSRATSLAEICRMVDLPKSSTLLLLRTLEARRYVVRDQAGYRLVRLPGEISAERPSWGTVLRLAEPWLREAVEATGESGFIAVFTEASHVRYLNKILPSTRELKYDRDISVDRTPHRVASGLALLAAMPGCSVERYLAALPVAAVPPPVPDPDHPGTVSASIQAVRAAGIAVNLAGRVDGAAGVAVAILGPAGEPVAAVNLAGPANRVRANLSVLKQAAQNAATRIGLELARRTPVSRPAPEHAA
jgi:IclR family transcriptional regulator, acetate operon repressor